jgi:hypothetical protein
VSSGLNQLKHPLAVVERLLLRHQQCEAIVFRQRGPAGAQIVAGGGLTASVQHDDKAGAGCRLWAQTKTSESARIRPKSVVSTSGLALRAAGSSKSQSH